jgi:hypothetical protein
VGLGVGLLWPRGTAGPAVFTYGPGGDIPEVPSSVSCLQGQLAVGRQYTTYVSCDDPHDVEIFERLDLFDSQLATALPRPGDGRRGRRARLCAGLRLREDRRGGQGGAAGGRARPSAEAFAYRTSPTSSFSTRSVLCVLYAADGSQLTGSRIAKPTA